MSETTAPDGWQGTPPAEGTRRKLIADTIAEAVAENFKPEAPPSIENADSFALKLADAVEEALIRVVDNGATPESGSPASVAMDTLDGLGVPRTRDGAILTISDRVTVAADELVELGREVAGVRAALDEAGIRRIDNEGEPDARDLTLRERVEVLLRVRQETIDGLAATVSAQADKMAEGRVPAGTEEVHVVLADNDADSPQMLFVELEDQDGRGIGSFERRRSSDGLTRIVIPYGRDDAWAASLVHRVAGAVVAGEPSGIACRRLLEEVGVRSLCDRHAEEELAKGVKSSPASNGAPPDEFDIRTRACERLYERLNDGPVPNPAELARVIDILR